MTTRNVFRQGIHAWLLVSLAMLCGCHVAAPPRYQTTWRRVTSHCYQPAHPYCHGFTPTQWTRWPDECQPQELIVAEELPLPLPPPPMLVPAPVPLEPAPVPPLKEETPPSPDEPPLPETPAPERLIVPQGYTPYAAAELPPSETVPSVAAEQPASAKKKSWTARFERFFGEVTTWR